jgi:hypothetical protein
MSAFTGRFGHSQKLEGMHTSGVATKQFRQLLEPSNLVIK